jgi:Putative restriction endonuclease
MATVLHAPGPFRAEHISEGSPYELSNGHPVLCLPTGRRGGKANLVGGEVLDTDPAAKSVGVDVGFSKDPGHLRAPDVSVGDFSDEPGWAPGSPALALEYADTGQDEAELTRKIAELLSGGTRWVWVVRLTGPRRVEIHQKGRAVRQALPGEDLVAPGVLQNPVPVLALFDRDAAHEATLRNLLQRRGYASLDAIRAEGKIEALLSLLEARGLSVSADQRATIQGTEDLALLSRWILSAATAATTAGVLAPARKPKSRRRPR